MNRLWVLAVALFTLACVDSGVDTNYDGNNTILSISMAKPSTKTSLGDRNNSGEYAISWSADDAVVVNGAVSSAISIDSNNSRKASFSFKGKLNFPYAITYPYTECSCCTAQTPTVVFPATQSYIEGTYDLNSTPMCGYASTASESIHLQHLAGVLRFSLLASADDTQLTKITIEAGADVAIAGEFNVDCQSGAIAPRQGETSNTITYTIPQGLALSKKTPSLVYVAIPKGSFGNCYVTFFDAKGVSMRMRWSANNVKGGVVREFKDIVYKGGATLELDSMGSEEDELQVDYIPGLVYGHVKDSNGNPLSGILISDGFQFTKTNAEGYYEMKSNDDAYHIFYISPSEYEFSLNEGGHPCFFQRYSHFHSRYDFTLTPLKGGAENQFVLFGLADPQVSNDTGYQRFVSEAVPKIKSHTQRYSVPCYGIVLGDIITQSASTDKTSYMHKMYKNFAYESCGLPIFYVMGNHDHIYHNSSFPLTVDWKNSSTHLHAQRTFEEIFGPANFSFNRGEAHIICMRNTVFTTTTTPSEYHRGFTDEQYAWLKADLANVPSDKLVILCVHIPLYDSTQINVQNVLDLLNKYKNSYVLSGHMHYNRNFDHSKHTSNHPNVYEHNLGAVCGTWWTSCICGDGAPNGYKVFEITGNKMTNWHYQGIPDGMDSSDYAMRLYRGNAITGAAIPEGDENTYGTKGYYSFNFASNVLLANIFSSDRDWSVEIYENGVKTGVMTLITDSSIGKTNVDELIGNYTMANPRRAADNVLCSNDFWAHGFQMGVLGRASTSNGSFTNCHTMWWGTLRNPNAASIEVVATDNFGKKHRCSTITEGTDYTYVAKPEM